MGTTFPTHRIVLADMETLPMDPGTCRFQGYTPVIEGRIIGFGACKRAALNLEHSRSRQLRTPVLLKPCGQTDKKPMLQIWFVLAVRLRFSFLVLRI